MLLYIFHDDRVSTVKDLYTEQELTSAQKMQAANSSEILVITYQTHGAITQNTTASSFTAMKTSNLA
jgi:hypothetical protein